MKLSQIAGKPQLVKIVLDDEDTIKEFNEPLEFWTWDRQPMATFLKLAAVDANNPSSIIESVKTLVLDEDGKEIISDDASLPTKVMMRVITKVVEGLGKS